MKYKYRKELIYHHNEKVFSDTKTLHEKAKEYDGDLQIQWTNLIKQPASNSIPVIKFTVQGKTLSTTARIAEDLIQYATDNRMRLISETTINYVYRK